MTTFIRISQLVSALRELNVISSALDEVHYKYYDGYHSITISATSLSTYCSRSNANKVPIRSRYNTIYHLFLESFSQSELLEQYYDDNKVSFCILK